MLLFSSYLTADSCCVPAPRPLATLWMRKHFTSTELCCFSEVCVVNLGGSQEPDAAFQVENGGGLQLSGQRLGTLMAQLCCDPSLMLETLAVLDALLVGSSDLQK